MSQTRRALLAPALLAVVLALLACAAPAGATISNLYTADLNEDPTDFFGMDDALFSWTTGDLTGGDVCIVSAYFPEDGDATCDAGEWGGTNTIASAAGSHFNLIAGPLLEPGDWKLMADNGEGDGDVFSEPFTVTACAPGTCNPRIAQEATAKYKAAAGAMNTGLSDTCLAFQLMPGGDLNPTSMIGNVRSMVNSADTAVRLWKQFWVSVNLQKGYAFATTQDVGGMSFGMWNTPADAFSDVTQSNIDIAMALARSVTCRASKMYKDIVADPPDPSFAGVVAPDLTDPPATGWPQLNQFVHEQVRQVGHGYAQLTAFERYQGAAAAGSDSGVHRQAAAIAADSKLMAAEMETSADQLRSMASTLAVHPSSIGDNVMTQAYVDGVDAMVDRVRDDGFSVPDRQVFEANGLTDEQVEQFRQQILEIDVTKVPIGKTISQTLVTAATALDKQAEPMAAFGRAALGVSLSTNRAPVARLRLPAGSPRQGVVTPFDGADSSDADGPIASYAWDFGDGGTATGPASQHTYATDGTYAVTLTVTDGDGAIASTTRQLDVGPALPANTTAPAVTGTARDGEILSVADGIWTGAPTFTRQWRLCDGAGAGCSDIDGATGSDHVVVPGDVGHRLVVLVTAANASGTATVAGAPTAVVVARAPEVGTIPTVSGGTFVDDTLTADDGSWTGTAPIAFTRRWRRCDSTGGACQDIAGATGSAYVVQAADAGLRLRFAVAATNGGGSAGSESDATDVIAVADPPVNQELPAVTGTPRIDDLLTGTTGTWTGPDPITYQLRWRRCDPQGAECVDLPGADADTYTPVAADVGKRLRLRVRAVSAQGSGTATSAATPVVVDRGPVNDVVPQITGGTLLAGDAVSSSDGNWQASSLTTFARQWLVCDPSGAACTPIAGQTADVLALDPAEAGHTVRLRVTATNSAGTLAVQSEPSALIGSALSAYVMAPGWKAADVALSFTSFGVGPVGVAFDPVHPGDLYIAGYADGYIVRIDAATGGTASRHRVNTVPIQGAVAGLGFTRDGRLYAALQGAGQVVEIDLADPAHPIKRIVASIPQATGLAVDPVSDDVFATSVGSGGDGIDIWRIRETGSGEPRREKYGSDQAMTNGVDGITFAPDGTLYGEDGGMVFRMTGTKSPKPIRTDIAYVPTVDGVAVSGGAETFVMAVRNDGIITKIDLSGDTPVLEDILTAGTRGDFAAVGYDGCLYATQSSTVVKVTLADGTCTLKPTSADVTAPVTVAQSAPAANGAGWNKQAVTIGLTAADEPSGSGLERLHYELTGAESGGDDEADGTASIVIGADGVTTVKWFAVDNAGNEEALHETTVRIDRTAPARRIGAPAVAAEVEQGAGGLVADYSCADSLSGVATCSAPFADGTALPTGVLGAHPVTVTALDLAGNSGTTTRSFTVVDRRAPVSSAARSVPPDASGVNSGPVTVQLTATDAAGTGALASLQGSGVAQIAWRTTGASSMAGQTPAGGGPVTIGTEGETQLHYRAIDNAGNSEAERDLTVRIALAQPAPTPTPTPFPAARDATAPTITIATPAEGATFLAGEVVQASFACADEAGGSGLLTCAAVQALRATAAQLSGTAVLDTAAPGAHVLTVAAADKAGNTATAARHYTVVKPETVFTLPSTRKCVSRRKFPIRLRAPKGETLVSATVLVNGKTAKVVTGKRLKAAINLAGLPKGRFRVEIVARTKSGRTVRSVRRYRTCAPKKRS